MAAMQRKIFCVREFIKTESATAVQRAFCLRFNIQPSTRKSICCWNHQFEQIFAQMQIESIFLNHAVHREVGRAKDLSAPRYIYLC